jgi:hypothetical protein
VIAWKLPRSASLVGIAAGRVNTRLTLLLDRLAPKAMRMDEAPLQTRTASGKKVVDLKAGYQVLGVSTAWAVPRPVAGQKVLPEKEIEVPDETGLTPASPEPEVEQLSFGGITPDAQPAAAIKPPKAVKPRSSARQTARSASQKTPLQAEQASLIDKPAPVKGQSPTTKGGRSKSGKRSGSHKLKGKPRTVKTAASSQKLIEKGQGSQVNALKPPPQTKPTLKPEQKPVAKRGQPVSSRSSKDKSTLVAKPSRKTAAKPAAKPSRKAIAKPVVKKSAPRKAGPTKQTQKTSTPKKAVKLPAGWKPLPARKSRPRRSTAPPKPKP